MELSIKIRRFFGYRYLVNLGSMEIHDLKNNHRNCHIPLITKKRFITQKGLKKILLEGFNGCRFCMKEYDKG